MITAPRTTRHARKAPDRTRVMAICGGATADESSDMTSLYRDDRVAARFKRKPRVSQPRDAGSIVSFVRAGNLFLIELVARIVIVEVLVREADVQLDVGVGVLFQQDRLATRLRRPIVGFIANRDIAILVYVDL